ncbi:type II toxin-antitoxin system HicA family toxin [Reichenbachiella ulvae]|uniref:type II toxin-antitoxin system HicA family toxin n=1 Tax=Reichenbachiella ulvae TaxID=2980104 RepID=UPI00384EFD14
MLYCNYLLVALYISVLMSRKDKLLDRLKRKDKSFSWSDLVTLLSGFGYEVFRGSGSRRKFVNPTSKSIISLHEPHPQKTLKPYMMKIVLEHLRENKLI